MLKKSRFSPEKNPVKGEKITVKPGGKAPSRKLAWEFAGSRIPEPHDTVENFFDTYENVRLQPSHEEAILKQKKFSCYLAFTLTLADIEGVPTLSPTHTLSVVFALGAE